MKRLLVVLLALAGLLGATPAQASEDLRVTVVGTSTLPDFKAGTCSVQACVDAVVAGHGGATWYFLPMSYEPISGNCGRTTATATIALADGSGSLVTEETAVVCFPGASRDAPGGMTSWGNPFRYSGAFSVVSATGSLSALAGDTGTVTVFVSGSAVKATYA